MCISLPEQIRTPTLDSVFDSIDVDSNLDDVFYDNPAPTVGALRPDLFHHDEDKEDVHPGVALMRGGANTFDNHSQATSVMFGPGTSIDNR